MDLAGIVVPSSMYCPNCFGKLYQNGHCSSCGYTYSDSNPNALESGRVIGGGRYYLGRVIGSGGFGITYKAFDSWNNLLCCVKEYYPTKYAYRADDRMNLLVKEESLREDYIKSKNAFISEIAVLMDMVSIRHVVNITDYFEENNTAYYVMDFLAGDTLAHIVKNAGFHIPFSVIRKYVTDAGRALDMVHSRYGILHRDISPENIMVLHNGDVKLIDFGSARQSVYQKDEVVSIKPQYAAIEQFTFDMPQGKYTDLYALATSIYYLASGVHIPNALERRNGATYTRLCELNPEVSVQESNVLDRAMSLYPQNRYRSIMDFLTDFSPSDLSTSGSSKIIGPSNEVLNIQPHEPVAKYIFLMERVMNGTVTKDWQLPLTATLSVGRGISCDICINDVIQMSRDHCTFFVQDGRLAILDRSSNGTWINGVRMEPHSSAYIENNSTVAFGIQENTFKVGMIDG